ncbi:hypothetical protein, conserved [Trypanosoma brucei brucei TREU927]|uniref:Uncharacterized protein n=1 Tax=Trypanosoma brucei brucei (strain 927/4 GUTat10.1) TaxID=185431 RepID=Q387G9_TRYB2|nr:hypothetical protein, conserved [Trypanosoma brucei brucei TREU927]EAN79062.1 hypothetical protein, conserved [Trypanosoma brucei brucei TREU927]
MEPMEQPPEQMLDVIRRAYDSVYLYGNCYAGIKVATSALNSGCVDECDLSVSENTAASSTEHSGGLSGVRLSDSSTQSCKTNNSSLAVASTKAQRGSTSMSNSVLGALGSGANVKDATVPMTLNRLQEFHLLLLRAEGYSGVRQHEKALKDAEAAIRISGGRSAEAHFILGRELLRLYRLEESVAAFQTAELLLPALAVDGVPFPRETDDEEFWAQRGYRLQDAEELKLKRLEVEAEEQQARAWRALECNSSGNAAGTRQRFLEPPFLALKDVKCGYPNLMKWRQLSREAGALLSAHTSHVFSGSYLQPTMAFMERRISSVRNGSVVCIHNTTSYPLKWVGSWFPDCGFHANMTFPQVIESGNCGVALLQPKGWGGYVGYVCYRVAECGICCFFCVESTFMGSVRCGVRFSSPYRIEELGDGDPDDAALKEFMNFKLPNSSVWLPSHTTAPPVNRRLKAWSAVSEGNRSSVFTVAEVLPIGLRAVELLTALEYAGPMVLKKLSAVSQRYRSLVNGLPPPMFHSPGRILYPDYCLRGDRVRSPWTVLDQDTVRWFFLNEGIVGNRERCVLADSTHMTSGILRFTREKGGSMDAKVYYGDGCSLIAQVKGSWIPFSSTLSFISSTGRTFATCYLNHSSQLTLSWGSAGAKSKPEDVEYVMERREARAETGNWRSASAVGKVAGPMGVTGGDDTSGTRSRVGRSSGQGSTNSHSSNTGTRFGAVEAYTVRRVSRRGGDSAIELSSSGAGGGETMGEVIFSTAKGGTPMKGASICEVHLYPGVDALLLSLMAYCRFNWEQ